MPVVASVQRFTFPVMGNTAHVTIVDGSQDLAHLAESRLRELESLWSRFVPTSDISRLNLANGEPVHVSSETTSLIRYMVGGWNLTRGLFDPSMLGELVDAGYGRSLVSNSLTILPTGVEWSRDLGSVSLDECIVRLPVGLTLDPGGIGKGLAADIVASELVELGAAGALVSVGGDVRCIGTGDIDGRWIIDVESPFDRSVLCSIGIADGAVATSSLSAKTFVGPDSDTGMRSHIMDPQSRRTVDMGSRNLLQASVVARECVWAEVFTKAYLVLDDPRRVEFAAEHGLAAMVVLDDGTMVGSQNWKKFER